MKPGILCWQYTDHFYFLLITHLPSSRWIYLDQMREQGAVYGNRREDQILGHLLSCKYRVSEKQNLKSVIVSWKYGKTK